ncbi:MAG TPA: endonuclease domain-containing protein [Thermoanaerobaculia bacterium]|nr:endonuclease domain-containing protein [Thermoanaerobaculia bacterium]
MAQGKPGSGQTLRSSSSLKRVSQGVRSTVRAFRQQQTPAENAFWELVRDRRLEGLKFRRQFPISIFVADFCCFDLKLIVELDGAVHETREQAGHDLNRDFYLQSLGYTLLRFPNEQVFANPSEILQAITAEARRLTRS